MNLTLKEKNLMKKLRKTGLVKRVRIIDLEISKITLIKNICLKQEMHRALDK